MKISESYQFDFKVIPIIIGGFYGGFRIGLSLIVIILCFRFSISIDFFITLMNYCIAATIMLFLKKKMETFTLNGKLFLLVCVYWLITVTRVIYLIVSDRGEQILLIFICMILSSAVLAIAVYIIHYYDLQIYNQNQLQLAERLNTVSQLAASVAHEVRNPMTSVKGFLQLIKTDNNLSDKQMKYIDISLGELSRTEAIINDYLSLAKPSPKEEQEILNVSAELKCITDIMISYTNTHNIEIESFIEDNLFCKGKRNEFRQALINIMKNSVEAMPTKGILTIRSYKKVDKICIEIQDNGEGMTEKQVKKLGTPYYSTKDKGTGVGLTLTFGIIREMMGEICIESQVGAGTTFKIWLRHCEAL